HVKRVMSKPATAKYIPARKTFFVNIAAGRAAFARVPCCDVVKISGKARSAAVSDNGLAMMCQQSALPRVGVPYDRLEVIVTRSPVERLGDAVGLRHQRRRITWSSRAQPDIEVGLRDPLHCLNHLEHRKAASVAAVESYAFASSAQILE